GGGGGTGGPVEGGVIDNQCGSVKVDTSVEEVITPGNVLIIFDQSQSMTAADFNGQVRWLAASDAVYGAIEASANLLTVGAIFFPSVDSLALFGACNLPDVAAIDDAAHPNPQIPFLPGPDFLSAWVAHWQRGPLRLSTPIDGGFVRGDEALAKAQLPGKTVVVFVTDGEPTCKIGNTLTDMPAKWASLGIPTYVVGLPGSGDGTLGAIAQAGGTSPFFTPADGAALQTELAKITSTLVTRSLNSCSIVFNEKPPNIDQIALVVTESSSGQKFRVEKNDAGWSLEPDGSRATLLGATCDDALDGRFASIEFAFGCEEIPTLR
ncbi:MAG: VWA domain-containing protein, partial [Deltaproteobacteria bacterium]|nr:VWA domain-containing protein [Deltaproteobacteria bacterium]